MGAGDAGKMEESGKVRGTGEEGRVGSTCRVGDEGGDGREEE